MERETIDNAWYNGNKKFSQHDVRHEGSKGFGAVADDHMERGIDLNEQLILNKPATFFFRMNGDAMYGAGISSGDVLIVDRSIKAVNGKIAVIAINGDLVVRRIQQHLKGITLLAENDRYGNIELTEFGELNVWGVVTCVIRILESRLLTHSNNQKNKDEDYRTLY